MTMIARASLLITTLFVSVIHADHALLRGSGELASLLCRIQLVLVDSEEEVYRSEVYECNPIHDGYEDGLSYEIDLPEALVREHRHELYSGNLFVSVPGGRIEDQSLIVGSNMTVVDDPTFIQQSQIRRRRLSESSSTKRRSLGERTVLVLRITTNDSTPEFSAEELNRYIFERDISLKRQFEACSFDRMTVQPTEKGVMDIHIDADAGGSKSVQLVNQASAKAAAILGVNKIQEYADHIMFCLPPGTGNWAATAAVNHYKSAYNNKWCAYPSAYMHEVSHNLGLKHGSFRGKQYADKTGYMSSGYAKTDTPFKCFNGGNNWQLGWYQDRSIEIDPSKGQLVTVAAFVDFDKTTENQVVLVKVGNLYLQYNRAKGINRETGQAKNQLTITEQKDEDSITELLGGIDRESSQFRKTDFMGSGSELVVEVCDVVDFDAEEPGSNAFADYMVISVGYNDSLCAQVAEKLPNSPAIIPETTVA